MDLRAKALRMGWRKRAIPALAGMVTLIATLSMLLLYPKALEGFGFRLFDEYQRAQPREYEDVGVRVVDIDEESLRRVGQWPWPRPLIAQMTERMVDMGAGVVAFDIVFAEPDRTSPENLVPVLTQSGADPTELAIAFDGYRSHDEAMGEAFSQLPVVLGYFFETVDGNKIPRRAAGFGMLGTAPDDYFELEQDSYRSVTQSLDVIADGVFESGFVSVKRDAGITRRAPLVAYFDGQYYPSLSLAVLRYISTVMGEANANNYRLKTSTSSRELGAGDMSETVAVIVGSNLIPTNGLGQMWMNFTEGYENRIIPAWKLLDPTVSDEELREAFEGTIVFVGTGAQGLRDLVATPVDPVMPGVLVHAQAVEQMLLGKYLVQPDWGYGVRTIALLLGGIILVLIVPIAGPLRSGLVGIGVIAGLFWMSWFFYTDRSLLFDPIYPAVALLLVYGATSLMSYVVTESEKAYIKDAFDRYLSPEMVEKIADDPSQLKLGGEERDMTILFSDIRSFSKISEGMTPEELTTYINRYLTPMTDILMDRKATVDKYIGDAIMSFWNAPLDDPDQYKNAARSALDMMEKLADLNARVGDADPDDPNTLPVLTNIGIGLHSGLTSVGNMGSDQRFAYSVLGDTVNTAARLEGMTKQYGVGILIGDELAKHLSDFALLELDRAKAVGKDAWLTIFCLLGDESVAVTPEYDRLVSAHSEFLAAYRAKDFDTALVLVDELDLLGQSFKLSPHYAIMKERIESYRNDPPPDDWEGVYVLRNK